MFNSFLIKTIFRLYNLIWAILIPVLRLNHRLKEGYYQRTLQQSPYSADLWIQAASVGESYLACELIGKLKPDLRINVLLTSNTSQGIKILTNEINRLDSKTRNMNISVAYFPFDQPKIMKKAVNCILPEVMVLLESEIWPGLMAELKKTHCKILLINGRMTQKSLSRYMKWPSFWRSLKPDHILAISKKDAGYFKKLFGSQHIGTMSNIKFDRFSRNDKNGINQESIMKILPHHHTFLVLGSIRQEEESFIEKMMIKIIKEKPGIVIGLFPRHMHRMEHWKNRLDRLSLPWELRSKMGKRLKTGKILIWDTFGELDSAYKLAKAAFVGGSLAPLGGQNFLEPLKYGIVPVIGPSWENFAWVGKEIIEDNLLIVARNWEEATRRLLVQMTEDQSKRMISDKAFKYLQERKGGTLTAADLIHRLLNKTEKREELT